MSLTASSWSRGSPALHALLAAAAAAVLNERALFIYNSAGASSGRRKVRASK
jgi:hypothetical protein